MHQMELTRKKQRRSSRQIYTPANLPAVPREPERIKLQYEIVAARRRRIRNYCLLDSGWPSPVRVRVLFSLVNSAHALALAGGETNFIAIGRVG